MPVFTLWSSPTFFLLNAGTIHTYVLRRTQSSSRERNKETAPPCILTASGALHAHAHDVCVCVCAIACPCSTVLPKRPRCSQRAVPRTHTRMTYVCAPAPAPGLPTTDGGGGSRRAYYCQWDRRQLPHLPLATYIYIRSTYCTPDLTEVQTAVFVVKLLLRSCKPPPQPLFFSAEEAGGGLLAVGVRVSRRNPSANNVCGATHESSTINVQQLDTIQANKLQEEENTVRAVVTASPTKIKYIFRKFENSKIQQSESRWLCAQDDVQQLYTTYCDV